MRSMTCELSRTVSLLLEDLDSSKSLSAAIMLRYGDWDGLASLRCDPSSYADANAYFRNTQAASLLRKCYDLPTSNDRRATAIEKWWDGERACFSANLRLTDLRNQMGPESPFEPRLHRIVRRIRTKVIEMIGWAPPSLIEGRFGPGATYSTKAQLSTAAHKIANPRPSATSGVSWSVLAQWLGTAWAGSVLSHQGEVEWVPGNRFTTVPKTSLTDRSIAVEPDINVFYQLGVGRVLRNRLKQNYGWDLATAQEVHGRVARESSVTREFCTLDLSNASDTLCRALVKLVLPPAWVSLLEDLRSPKTLIDGKWVVLEKFSSMGNGFTFELETIIFAAIALVASEETLGWECVLGHDVYVFGDDIIVRNDVYRPLKSALEFFGFAINGEKSFFGDSPFRESCGQDFYQGVPVRPFFLKGFPNEPQENIVFANGLRTITERAALCGHRLGGRAWLSILDCIPNRVRQCRGPKELGDIVIHDVEERWTIKQRNGIRYLRCFKVGDKRRYAFDRFEPEVVLACAVYGLSVDDPRGWSWTRLGGLSPRDSVLGYRIGWVAFS